MARTVKKKPIVSFDCPEAERKLIRAIARRARALLLDLGVDRPALDIDMDIAATHCNGNTLRLVDLLAADDFNLMHDVSKIARHLDRETGKLTDNFRPRFSKPVRIARNATVAEPLRSIVNSFSAGVDR